MPISAFSVGSGVGFGNELPGHSHFGSQDGLQCQSTPTGFLPGEIKL